MSAALQADRILAEFDALWATLGSETGEGVLRACAMTLVAFMDAAEDSASVTEALAELIRDHPNRAIVVRAHLDGDAALDHRVSAQCWRPFGRREQICCEHVEIDVAAGALEEIAPVLVALAAPDLPVVVWRRGARVLSIPVDALSARKIVVDTAALPSAPEALRWVKTQLETGAPIADLAWTRITVWRELIAQAFENLPCRRAARRIGEIGVSYSGDAARVSALYLAGWVASAASVEAKTGIERVEGGESGVRGITLRSPELTVSARRAGGAAVEVNAGGMLSSAACPRLGEAALLAEELSIFGPDPVFEAALRRAVDFAE